MPHQRTTTPKPMKLSRLSARGYKSFNTEQHVTCATLTVLSGANSSGKSSAIQPLLLLKQTLNSPHDPGPLRIDGPNVAFSNTDEMFSCDQTGERKKQFTISLVEPDDDFISLTFTKSYGTQWPIDLSGMTFRHNSKQHSIVIGDKGEHLAAVVSGEYRKLKGMLSEDLSTPFEWRIVRSRCVLGITLQPVNSRAGHNEVQFPVFSPSRYTDYAREAIHIAGFRGNPNRSYRLIHSVESHVGLFHEYTASMIDQWQAVGDPRLIELNSHLYELGLTSHIYSERVSDTEVRLLVHRYLSNADTPSVSDFVNIADVGFGVSQCLPVIIALLAAKPNQLVIIEQPELHLHPLAQYKLAKIIATHLKRGVHIIVETHSRHLLMGLQVAVASSIIAHTEVALNWFSKSQDGFTTISSAKMDKSGSFGDWPTDFDDATSTMQLNYIEAYTKSLTQ